MNLDFTCSWFIEYMVRFEVFVILTWREPSSSYSCDIKFLSTWRINNIVRNSMLYTFTGFGGLNQIKGLVRFYGIMFIWFMIHPLIWFRPGSHKAKFDIAMLGWFRRGIWIWNKRRFSFLYKRKSKLIIRIWFGWDWWRERKIFFGQPFLNILQDDKWYIDNLVTEYIRLW